MLKKSSKSYAPTAFSQASILRKFTVMFLVMSIVPTSVLYYFYEEFKRKGSLQLDVMDFNLTLTFVILGVLLGYFTMRSILKELVDLTDANKKALENVVGLEKAEELSKEENEVVVLAQAFSTITDKLEENVRNLEMARKTLQSIMNKVGKGIANMDSIDTFLELIIETITEAMSGKIGVLLLKDKGKKDFWTKTVHGADTQDTGVIRIATEGKTVLNDAFKIKIPIIFSRLSPEIAELKKYSETLFEAPMIFAPLVNKDKIIGVITVSGRENEEFDSNEQDLLFNLISQTAIAIVNAQLNKDKEKTYFETVSALALAVDARDKFSRGHLSRVAGYCSQIANKMGLDDEEITTLRNAARLHDLGKIGIPDDILGKKGSLNDQEWALMKKHPEIGEGIISPVHSLNHLCDIVRHHHEKLDGSGYPDGLKGDEITPLVRIVTVADIYDALTTDRPYRKKYSKEKAFDILHEMKGLIDPDIVDIFIETQLDH